jgi:hypothetical protein
MIVKNVDITKDVFIEEGDKEKEETVELTR